MTFSTIDPNFQSSQARADSNAVPRRVTTRAGISQTFKLVPLFTQIFNLLLQVFDIIHSLVHVIRYCTFSLKSQNQNPKGLITSSQANIFFKQFKGELGFPQSMKGYPFLNIIIHVNPANICRIKPKK